MGEIDAAYASGDPDEFPIQRILALQVNEYDKWLEAYEKYNSKWKARLFWISFGTLITLFSGTFVSTTPGANLSCGVNGLFGSWPLCNGYFAERIENIVDQSQMIHRWFVVLMQIALFWLSYKIWEENSESNSDGNLRFWIWSSTGVYFTNILMGAFYVLSWTLDNGHIEILSLIHLLFATISFLLLATASLLLALNTKKEMKYSALETWNLVIFFECF